MNIKEEWRADSPRELHFTRGVVLNSLQLWDKELLQYLSSKLFLLGRAYIPIGCQLLQCVHLTPALKPKESYWRTLFKVNQWLIYSRQLWSCKPFSVKLCKALELPFEICNPQWIEKKFWYEWQHKTLWDPIWLNLHTLMGSWSLADASSWGFLFSSRIFVWVNEKRRVPRILLTISKAALQDMWMHPSMTAIKLSL